MQLDAKKIQKTIDALNKETGGNWIVVDGFHSITSLEINADGTSVFHGAQGLPLKSFINTKNGEVRTFHVNALKVENAK